MVKQNKKARVRKLDVSSVTDALVQKTVIANKKKDDSLFFHDTQGSTQGHSKSARRALALEKRKQAGGKATKKLSELELEKIDRARERNERRIAQPAPKKTKNVFDIWDDAEEEANVQVKGIKDNKTVDAAKADADVGNKRREAVGGLGPSRWSAICGALCVVLGSCRDHQGSFLGRSFSCFRRKRICFLEERRVRGRGNGKDKNKTTIIFPEKNHYEFEENFFEKIPQATFVNLESNTARMKPKRAPRTLFQKTSKAPAVVLPGSGLSVNPGEQHFENAVEDVVATEMVKFRAEEDARKKRAPMTAKLSDAFTHEELKNMDNVTKLREFKKLMHAEHGVECDEAGVPLLGGEDDDTTNRGGSKKNDRLTQAQRNKRDRVKKESKEMSAQRLAKKLEKSIGQVPNLIREMQKEAVAKQEEKSYIDAKKQEAEALEEKGMILAVGRCYTF